MDSSGQIYTADEVAAIDRETRARLGMTPIPQKVLASVQAMTIPDRQAWHERRKTKRLAAKRARQARRKNR